MAWSGALASLFYASLCWGQNSVPLFQDSKPPTSSANLDPVEQDVLDMDLDQLSRADVVVPAMDTLVSTVTRQESTVGRSPAAIYVITQEMIQRSGALTIPDVLRMVPGVEVAQIDANKWAVSIRGFNGRVANKLLVQIDGRTVYTQSFSGVFWDMNDLVLQDIERIEVIRGSGAIVWGANAVNGVINIITKRAQDTQGLLVSSGTGTEERSLNIVRYGGQTGDDLYWRVYGKQFDRDQAYSPDTDFDDWRQGRGGFRADWMLSDCDALTVQGDFYEGDSGTFQTVPVPAPPFIVDLVGDTSVRGQNYLTRWTHAIDEDTEWGLQVFYDHWERGEPIGDNGQTTFDVDYQLRFPWGQNQHFVVGAGFRQIHDHILFDPRAGSVNPPFLTTRLYSCFIQDEITLDEDRWYLIAGSRFEHNDFSGFEYQPSVRMLFLPSERESVWAAVSRAVRTPNRIDQSLEFTTFLSPIGPTYAQFTGDDNVASEELLAFELGYRAQPTDDFSWDLVGFYNHYDNIIANVSAGAPFFDPSLGGFVIPFVAANIYKADSYGAELASTFQVNPNWQLSGSYSLLYLDIHAPPDNLIQGSSPNNEVYVRSSWNPSCDTEVDLIGRYVDNLPAIGIHSYVTMDVRFAWKPYKNLEWAVVGRNLLDSPHAEFSEAQAGVIGTEVQSEVYTTLTWTH